MFCPSCGRQNARDQRFCASCGTNLEAVSEALTGAKDDFFTKTDAALDQLVARYAEHVFKDAPSRVRDKGIAGSWTVLGQGVLTSFVDMVLFTLMWNVLPLRFLILLISTPIRVLTGRTGRQRKPLREDEKRFELPAANPPEGRWLPGQVSSISEHTTDRLPEYVRPGDTQGADQE